MGSLLYRLARQGLFVRTLLHHSISFPKLYPRELERNAMLP